MPGNGVSTVDGMLSNSRSKKTQTYIYPWCALEVRHIRNQPHPLNWERGNLFSAYDGLIAFTRPDTEGAWIKHFPPENELKTWIFPVYSLCI